VTVYNRCSIPAKGNGFFSALQRLDWLWEDTWPSLEYGEIAWAAVLHKATGTFLKVLPLLARDSPLTIPNKILLYKFLLRSMITYAAPVWSSTSLTNYRHLQVYQSKCPRVIEDFPRRTPISNLHTYLQMTPIRQFIYNLTDKSFVSCPAHPNPLIRNTENYTLEDLHRQYPKYRHKRIIKHILL
jgi:hypothetical protein